MRFGSGGDSSFCRDGASKKGNRFIKLDGAKTEFEPYRWSALLAFRRIDGVRRLAHRAAPHIGKTRPAFVVLICL